VDGSLLKGARQQPSIAVLTVTASVVVEPTFKNLRKYLFQM
jgi:hypothetical protein